MYRIIIILLVCTNSIIAQNKNLNDLLFWEYKIFENPQQKDSLLLYQINKLNIYILNKKFNADLINEFKGINWLEIKDSLTQMKYLQNLAIVHFLNNEPAHFKRASSVAGTKPGFTRTCRSNCLFGTTGRDLTGKHALRREFAAKYFAQ